MQDCTKGATSEKTCACVDCVLKTRSNWKSETADALLLPAVVDEEEEEDEEDDEEEEEAAAAPLRTISSCSPAKSVHTSPKAEGRTRQKTRMLPRSSMRSFCSFLRTSRSLLYWPARR